MPRVPRELDEYRLEVNKTARPIKQKLQRFAKDRKQAIEVEVCKLLAAGLIRECQHSVWLTNPVLVPKKTGGLRMCIDYTDLNKHCPKDPFPKDTQPQKLLYALLITSRKLRHYFQAHKIVVPSSFPLGEIIRNHNANGRIVKWSVELGEFEIEFFPRQAIK
jgi:hypothetical protein